MYKYKVKNISIIEGNTIILDVAPLNGEVFSYIPGQYAMITPYDEKGYPMSSRPFSIASSPTQKEYLQFGIKIIGNFTKRLSRLRVGDKVSISEPYGEFTYNEKKYPDSVFIAGGIGITPFINAIRYARDKQISQNITLLYSNRKLAWTAFRDELINISQNSKNIRTIFSITDETIITNEDYLENKIIDKEMIIKYIKSGKNKTFFICGPQKFMDAMEKNLISLGVAKENIKHELFSAGSTTKSNISGSSIFLYAGALMMFFLFFASINNAEGKKIKTLPVPTVPTKTVSNDISLINNVALNRKKGLEDIQRNSRLYTKNAESIRQAKIQENIFKQNTARRKAQKTVSTPTYKARTPNRYTRRIRLRTTLS